MDKEAALKKTSAKYLTPIDPIELAVRLAEAFHDMKRPPGSTSLQAFVTMEEADRNAWLGAANAAMRYWQECIASANTAN